ncbi:Hypothetical predicted protein [Cloeon dipterum]|uniref:Uncharacterized protein n=1 Tax=Cloeon dipterum TaxID=197152 RepID=A0A8S1DYX6_9INSE|nr:Hypothetical predicted protein [Cloeon dipterum]
MLMCLTSFYQDNTTKDKHEKPHPTFTQGYIRRVKKKAYFYHPQDDKIVTRKFGFYVLQAYFLEWEAFIQGNPIPTNALIANHHFGPMYFGGMFLPKGEILYGPVLDVDGDIICYIPFGEEVLLVTPDIILLVNKILLPAWNNTRFIPRLDTTIDIFEGPALKLEAKQLTIGKHGYLCKNNECKGI